MTSPAPRVLALLLALLSPLLHAVTLEQLRERGEVRMAIANEAPYAYLALSGEVTGEAPAVAKAVFKAMGIDKVKPIIVEFGSLIPGLKARRFDVIAAGMYITPERCEQILFSEPSYKIGEGFLVKKGNPKDLHGYSDVKERPAIKLGIVAGTVEMGYAKALGIPKEQLVILPDTPSALAAVRSGRVDAYAGTALTVARLARQVPAVEAAQPFTDPSIEGKAVAGYGGFGFHRDDKALRDAFDAALKDYLGTPEWKAAVTPHGFGEHTRADRSRAELCGTTP